MLAKRTEKSLRKRSWGYHALGGFIAISLMSVVFLLTIRPIESRKTQLVQRSAELEAELSIRESVEAEHQQLVAEISKIDDKVDELLNRIPNVPRESDFLGQVTTLADNVGLTIVDYQPGGVSDEKGYKQMTLTLSSNGSYEAICRFLHEIHNLPRLSRVLKLDINPDSRLETFKMQMVLTIFFSPGSQLTKA